MEARRVRGRGEAKCTIQVLGLIDALQCGHQDVAKVLRDHSKAERPRQRGNLGRLAEREQNLVGKEQQGQRGQEADKDDSTRSLDV